MRKMTLISENTSRKVDSLGRISIPKSIRDRFNIGANDEIEFSICHMDNQVYICMNKKNDASKAEILAAELDALGIEIPEKLMEMLD